MARWWLLCLLSSEAARTPRKDDDDHHCSGHGATSAADGFKCTCMSGWTGPNCAARACPTGRAWADFPSAIDEAHGHDVECSGMGFCDYATGLCECRALFEGAACERLACPTDAGGSACSGHGQCVTAGWAAQHWDGRTLIRPNVTRVRRADCDESRRRRGRDVWTGEASRRGRGRDVDISLVNRGDADIRRRRRYTHWDAEKTTGCLCDPGYSGFNCSRVDCPRGDIPETTGQRNEVARLECKATSGSFTLTFRGATTVAIPYDAPYERRRRTLSLSRREFSPNAPRTGTAASNALSRRCRAWVLCA